MEEIPIINKEAWDRNYQEAKILSQEIYSVFWRLVDKGIIDTGGDETGYLKYSIIPKLQEYAGIQNFNELYHYVTFHPLITSTPNPSSVPLIDVPGDKIRGFLKLLFDKLKEAEASGQFDLESLK